MSDVSNPSDDSHKVGGSDGNYVVVARRYRPRGFDELVGQEHVGRALKNAIETNRVGHAYLFTGARGVGKTSTARIFAKALNNPDGPSATPDNESDTALAIDSGEDVDVIEIDGASNRGIDEIRSLRANVGVRPSRSRYKIYIIDEVHMLTSAAFNALLKTLEEPPEHVKFIFCTTDPEKIPITVLSRCQRFDFAPVEVPKIVDRLRTIVTAENASADDAALELIARRAAGSMRDSQSLLEQVLSFSDGNLTAEQVHAMLGTADDERLHSLAKAMAARDPAEALKQMDAGIDAGVDAGRLAEQLLGYFRDLMAVTVGCEPSLMRHTSAALHDELKELGQQWGLQTVLAVVGLIDQTLVRIRHSVYARVLLEATLIQICSLPDLQKISDIASASFSAADGTPKTATEKKNVIPRPHLKPTRNSGTHASVAESSGNQPALQTAGAPATSSAGTVATSVADVSLVGASSVGATDSVATGPGSSSTAAANSGGSPALPASSPASAPSSPKSTASSPESTASAANVTPDASATTSAAASDTATQTETNAAAPAATAQSPAAAPVSSNAEPWIQSTADRVWPAAIDSVESMTQSLAHAVERVVVDGNDRLRLIFPGESKLAMSRCDLPEHRNALTAAVSRLAGRPITLAYEAGAPKRAQAPVVEQKSPAKNRMQRMKEIENNELVRSCVELFGAEIVRIDKPR